jgi:two-component system nitrate/nitrite response regulator NarL
MSTSHIVSCDEKAAPSRGGAIGIVVLSDVRFVRDALVAIFERSGKLDILGVAAELGAAFEQSIARHPDIVLIDTNLPDGFATVRLIKQRAPQVRIVALALAEREDEVIAWAEAGVSGYIPRSAALNEVVDILQGAMRGEQVCSPRVASGLVRRLAIGAGREQPELVPLTRRELEIVQLINEGLSNKEIAHRLKIGLATAKSHVHNVLGKLGLGRRSQAAQWMRAQSRAALLGGDQFHSV